MGNTTNNKKSKSSESAPASSTESPFTSSSDIETISLPIETISLPSSPNRSETSLSSNLLQRQITKLVWFDPRIENRENRDYIEKWAADNYVLVYFSNLEEAINTIKLMDNVPMIVITSGRSGKRFVPEIQSLKQILGVIVFCRNVEFHQEWTSQYTIVKKICKSFKDVKSEIEKLNSLALFASATPVMTQRQILEDDGVDDSSRSYFHCSLEKALEFKILMLLEDRSNRDPKYELCDLNKSKTPEIRRHYEMYEKNTLQAICFVYSTQNVYREFNRACANRAYYRVSSSIRIAVKELKNQKERMYVPIGNGKLYRGVKRNQIKIEEYVEGKCGFFSGFTSSSVDKSVAVKWGDTTGVVFVIRLSKNYPYPNVTLFEPGWSAFTGEQEVLIFPFFSFRITKVVRRDQRDWVYIEQNEKDSVLTLDMNEEWINSILEAMGSNIEKEIEDIRSFPLFDVFSCAQTDDFKIMFVDDSALPGDIFTTLLWEKFSKKYETEERYIRIMDVFLKQVFKKVSDLYAIFDGIFQDERIKALDNREDKLKEFLNIMSEPYYKDHVDKCNQEYEEYLHSLKGTWIESISHFLQNIKKF